MRKPISGISSRRKRLRSVRRAHGARSDKAGQKEEGSHNP